MFPRSLVFAVLFATAAVVRAEPALPGQPLAVTHAGRLLDGRDMPVTEAELKITFRIYNARVPGDLSDAVIWDSGTCTVEVKNGTYAVVLGEGCTGGTPLLTSHLPTTAPRFLEVSIGTQKLLPRLLLGAVPTAAVASRSLDAQALQADLAAAGTLNAPANPVDFTKLKNVPADLADGDEDTTYTAGAGLALDGTEFAVAPAGVQNAMLANPSLTIATGSGLTGGGSVELGTERTLALADTAVLPGTYSNATLTVDQQGRLTGASSGIAPITKLTAGTGLTGGTIAGGVGAIGLANDGVASAQLKAEASSLTKVSGGAMSTDGTKVGIGTAAPADRLHVAGPDVGVLVAGVDRARVNLATKDRAGWQLEVANASAGSNQAAGALGFTEQGVAGKRLVLAPGGNVGIGLDNPAARLDVSGTFRAGQLQALADGVVQTSELTREFSGYIRGPGNWPACSDGPKVVTIGRLSSGDWSSMTIEFIGDHRGMAGSYRDYSQFVVTTGDHYSIYRVNASGNVRVTPWNGSADGEIAGKAIGGGADVQFRVAPNCGANIFYRYVVRYGSNASFVPSTTRSW